MAYLGNTLQVAFPSYRNIDDISGSFNGVITTFPLRVSGAAPVPFPISSNQCLISVGGVVQRPDDSGTEGFRISGTNIIFSSAPAGGADFFGVILAGADYVNVGATFPSGTAIVPSITFDSDLDTGIYNPNANEIGFTTAGTARLIIDANGQVKTGGLGTTSNPVYSFNSDPNTGIYSPGSDQLAISTNGTDRLFIDGSGRLLVGTSSSVPIAGVSSGSLLQIETTEANVPFGFSSIRHGGTNANVGSVVYLGRSRGTTVGSVTSVVDGDTLGFVAFGGANGSNYSNLAAWITAQVDGVVSGGGANDMPGRLIFSTTADGASSPTERMRIAQNGVITIQNGAVAVIGTLTDGATITPDFAADCNFTVTLGGARTIANPSNLTAGQSGSIFLVQDATGGRTVAWGSSWDFPGGTAPTLSSAANAVDRIDYVVRSSTSIHTVFTANYS